MNGNAALLQQHAEALALSSPLLLPYERQLLEDAIMDDSMIITAAGLGWQRVAAVLLRIAQHARMAGANELDAPQAQNQLASQQQHSDPAHPQPAAAASAAARATSSPTAPPVAAAPGPQHPARGGLPGCVLVLGASPWQRALITSELARHDPSLPPPVDITNEVPASERVQLYRASPGGRPLFITPRILVVDLLSHRLRGREVAGVLLLNAHRASDTSGEGFAVALLRADCPAGGGRGGASAGCWVRALSDAPVAFNQGFNRVEKVMKALHLRRLHLWPRFQEHVRQCLDEHKPVVVEWDQELSGAMLLIQAALLEVLEGLIRELRRTNNKLDTSELVLENGVLRSFDEIVRRQLDPIWHTVSWKTRRICADLRTLRELSALLLSTDCVTFLAHLEGLRQSEGVRCVWLFHDATHAIYEQARRRVYIYRQQGAVEKAAAAAVGSGSGGGEGSEVEAVLEEPPKWGLLVEVLGEVQRQRRQLRALGQLHPQGAAAAIAAAGQREGAAADTTTRGSGGGGAQDRGRSTTEASIRSRTAAAAESGVEVVDLASSDEGSDGAEEDEEDGRQVRGRAAGVAAGGTAAASNARGGAAAAGAGGAEADAAVDGPSLRALLEELGLLSDTGGAAGGGGAAASGAAAAGGDKAGGPSGSGAAGAVPGCGPADAGAAAAVVTPRDLRLLAEAGRGPVLVVARELHSARLLERVVREGGRAVMQHLYESYLLSKLSTSEGGAGRGGANGGGGGTTGGRAGGRAGGRGGGWKRYRGGGGGDPDESGRGPVLRPGEHQALLAEAHRVGAERGDLTEAPGGRAAKRAKLGQGEAGGAAGGTAGGGRGARGRVSAAGGGGSARGRGRRGGSGGGGARRQRKPDDSPVRVAAAAEEEGMEEEEEEQERDKGIEGRAAAATRAATATGAHSGVLPRAGRAGRAGRGAAATHAGGGNGDDDDDDEGGASDPQSDADEWADRGQQPRSRRAAQKSRGGGGTGGRRRAGDGGGRSAGRAEQRGGRGRGGGRGGNGAAAPGKGRAPATAGGRGAAAAARPESAAAAGGATTTGPGGGDGLGAGSPSQPSSPPPPLLVDVHFVSLDSHDEFVLWRLRPSFVIMYEPDLAFLRQVEVYQAERCLAGGCPLWLHTLSYGQSLEQQRFRAAVERERDTLLRLIQVKQHLVLPAQAVVAQGPNGATGGGGGGVGALSADLWLDVYSANALTRVAGGRAAARGGGLGAGGPGGPKRLVVDVREFMSSLPAVLHQKGFELLPVTLEVGDYVLSPQLVVERKSLPDLHASLASGRLYHQAEVMCRHYARPLLLIEFDADRQFGLQSASELGDDIDPKNVISKLTLLTLHFPKLRLLWSRSPHATADLFASLKSNQDEPDPAAAALVGVPLGPDGVPLPLQPGAAPGQGQGSGAAGGPAAAYPLESVVNQPALELLRRLPGVNDSNYRAILGHVSSLAELAALPLQRLESIMASAKNARALREFLDAPCPRI
ncbi:hypothetical protein PLESTB_000071900 [Pleodorina starrii]|uniref:ERCC4 domain-containing protein n=1 Tax=Pleodorina starrii TaxID=330485 RepID=A0A9W6B9R6_9CHLO|nr:hypothetical protein PLESTM_000067500 [Pleodorina starrii]GLC48219.1 hypothetical protein PLESTB_000071900 [Pleodorina starrii]